MTLRGPSETELALEAAAAPAAAAALFPPYPAADGRVVFLLDAASAFEERLLREWIERVRPASAGPDVIPIPASRRARGALGLDLEAALAAGDDALFAPLRISACSIGSRRSAAASSRRSRREPPSCASAGGATPPLRAARRSASPHS
jgi:hypothetical protein